MTILKEILESGLYKVPKALLEDPSKYGIQYHSDDSRQTGTITITRIETNEVVLTINLPEHYVETLLEEYVVGSFISLTGTGSDTSLEAIIKDLTSINRERYTRENGTNNHPDRSQLNRNEPELQQSGLLEPPSRQWWQFSTTGPNTPGERVVPTDRPSDSPGPTNVGTAAQHAVDRIIETATRVRSGRLSREQAAERRRRE